MKKQNEKFLEFNGRTITFLASGGIFWVAIKPICEALNVDYINQFKRVKNDEILGQLLSEQTMVGADNRLRKMVCLPEKFIYGWLFQIQSSSSDLVAYKKECYDVLFDHFHGGIRQKKLAEKLMNTAKIEALQKKIDEKLLEDEDYKLLNDLNSANISLGKEISQLQKEEIKNQLNLFRQETN